MAISCNNFQGHKDKNYVEDVRELKEHAAPGVHDAVINSIVNILTAGSKVLELGAGSGAFSLRLINNNYIVTASGIESESFLVKQVPYILINLNEELAKEYYCNFDAVIAIEVIEHLENIFDFFRKINLLLKVGGIAFITTPNISSIRSRLTFLYQGLFTYFSPNQARSEGGHIEIIPGWLLKIAAEKARLRCLKMFGVGQLNEHYYKNKWKNIFIKFINYIFKLFCTEKYAGEFSCSCILLILTKDN